MSDKEHKVIPRRIIVAAGSAERAANLLREAGVAFAEVEVNDHEVGFDVTSLTSPGAVGLLSVNDISMRVVTPSVED